MDKVMVRRLPTVEAPIPSGGGRLITPAGELAQIVNGEAFRFLAYLEFDPRVSAGRGNHYHAQKTEHLYIISGVLRGTYVDLVTGERSELELTGGDLVTVLPGCAHAYATVTHSHAVEFCLETHDPGDTIPFAME